MTVATTQDGNFIRISGTIAEVLASFKNMGIKRASQVKHYTDNGTNASAIVSNLT